VYFEVQVHNGQIVLTPVRIQRGDAVRVQLAALGLPRQAAELATDWARGAPKSVAPSTGVEARTKLKSKRPSAVRSSLKAPASRPRRAAAESA